MTFLLWHSVLAALCFGGAVIDARLGNVWWAVVFATVFGMNVLIVVLEVVA